MESAEVCHEITLDTEPPTGLSVSINGGAECSDSSMVTVSLAASEAFEMRLRNDGGVWTNWHPFAATQEWQLQSWPGPRSVGFQCRDGCGNVSAEATDTIVRPKFDDVSCGNSQRDYVEALVGEGITSGCATNPPLYCPYGSITRAQMAVFIIRAMGQTPYDKATPTFTDVPKTNSAYGYIERIYQLGITGGCSTSPMRYCPDAPVSRYQMAVFLCRATGKTWLNPGTPSFADVPTSASYYGYVERLADPGSWGEGAVTGGCGTAPRRYCPYGANTRGQMAVFICRAFGLPL
jgi:hypothetical protein